MNNIEKIRKAMQEQCTLNLTYKKMVKKSISSETKDYFGVEPYEIRGDRLWVFDPAVNHVRNLVLREDAPQEGIIFCKVNENQKFKPRYAIKGVNGDMLKEPEAQT